MVFRCVSLKQMQSLQPRICTLKKSLLRSLNPFEMNLVTPCASLVLNQTSISEAGFSPYFLDDIDMEELKKLPGKCAIAEMINGQ